MVHSIQGSQEIRIMSIGKRILFISLLLLALVAGMISNPFVLTASAQTPRTISYQGILTSSGTPASGQHLVHIALYDSITSGHLLYEETQQADVVGGVFNITIGSVTPLPASLRFDRPYYFGVSVDGNP